jgi:hypothetical protein
MLCHLHIAIATPLICISGFVELLIVSREWKCCKSLMSRVLTRNVLIDGVRVQLGLILGTLRLALVVCTIEALRNHQVLLLQISLHLHLLLLLLLERGLIAGEVILGHALLLLHILKITLQVLNLGVPRRLPELILWVVSHLWWPVAHLLHVELATRKPSVELHGEGSLACVLKMLVHTLRSLLGSLLKWLLLNGHANGSLELRALSREGQLCGQALFKRVKFVLLPLLGWCRRLTSLVSCRDLLVFYFLVVEDFKNFGGSFARLQDDDLLLHWSIVRHVDNGVFGDNFVEVQDDMSVGLIRDVV